MKIKFNGKYSYTVIIGHCQKILFKPGKNYISDEEWKKVKQNPLVKERIAKGDIIAISEKELDEDIETDEKIDMEKMNVKKAIEFIKNCADVKVLEDLLEKEERKTVQQAIQKQLESLEEIEEIEEK